jgi:hypothetical protein
LFPGSGSSTDPLSPGYPNTVLPGQTPAVPYSPGAVLPDPASFSRGPAVQSIDVADALLDQRRELTARLISVAR